KGRYEEGKLGDDHLLKGDTYPVLSIEDGQIVSHEIPALLAINERLRDDYIRDSNGGVQRWNKVIEKAGCDFRLNVPHKAFNRKIGTFSEVRVSPEGNVIAEEQWTQQQSNWLPTPEDRAFVASLMGPVTEPGKFANWIAPPPMGINKQPIDFDYIRFA
ncbi:MAG: benzoyl-CoA 2,3-epoxidase subunit BoxB, partial [Rhodoferax sp.]